MSGLLVCHDMHIASNRPYFALILLIISLGIGSGVDGQAPITVLPYERENNRIRLSLNFDGVEVKMLLDSGATTTILFADKSSKFQRPTTTDPVSISFPALNQTIKGARLDGLRLTAPGLEFTARNTVLLKDKAGLRNKLVLRYDGILGQEFFASYAIALDPEKRTLTLYAKGTDLGEFYRSKHRLHFQGTAAHVRFTSKLPWETSPSLKEMLLDTGYPGALVIWDKKHFDKAAKKQNRKQLIAENTGISSRANFRFGTLKFVNSPIFLGANPPPQITDRNGLMGAAVLNNFYYAIDFTSRKLWISSKKTSGYTKVIDGTLYTPNGENAVYEDFKDKPSVSIRQVIKFED